MNLERKKHWENIHTNKNMDEVGWYQKVPKVSMHLIKALNLSKETEIIDIGGGDSLLVDHLIEEGYQNLTVLDISEQAIEKAKFRLGANAENISWIVSDILDFKPSLQYDLWHDRAAFHFLTINSEVKTYVDIASNAVKSDGNLILATFSEDGPEKCSGLTIQQYAESELADQFSASFKKIQAFKTNHETPSKSLQNFLFCCFKKTNK